jgi:hypothetical protein
MSVRRYVLVWLVSLCGLAGPFAFATASASAAVTHHFLSQITEVPAGPGVVSSGPLIRPQGLAVDSGSLYVADGETGEGQGRLDKFDASSGALTLQFAPAPSLSYLREGVAVAHGTGEVYVGADEYVEGAPEGRVAVFNAAGNLQHVWTGADTPSGRFGCFECSGPGDVAVDNNPSSLDDWAAGDVYVALEQGVVDVFKPKAGGEEEYVTRLEREPGVPFSQSFGVAVDPLNGDVLVLDEQGVDVFEPTVLDQYALVRRLTETAAGHPFGNLDGIAVDGSNGDIYVSESNPRMIDQFNSAGVYLGRLTGTPSGSFGYIPASLAVDPATHDVYVGDDQAEAEAEVVDVFGPSVTIPDVATEPASAVKPRGATLNGTVDPEAIQLSDCRFDYGTTNAYGQSAPCVPAAGTIPADSAEHAVSVPLAGLAPDTTYHFRLQASNGNGTNTESADREFTTSGPGIHETSVVNVTSDSATLEARIDPDGAATTYYFQYGTSTAYGSDAPAPPGATIGAGKGDVEVSQPVRLAPGTLYHYRVVVRSEPEPGEPFEEAGPDQTFTTQSGEASTLPDGRAWEMVSPPDKHGATLESLSPDDGGLTQAARNGSAITYLAKGPIEGNPAGNRSLLFTQVLSTRGADGWDSQGIATPSEVPAWSPTLTTGEYKQFSSDLSLGVVEPSDETLLAPGAAHGAPYRREADGSFTPLVLASDLPAGVELNAKEGVEMFRGASPDLSHIVLQGRVPLLPNAVTRRTESEEIHPGLYEWSGGSLSIVSILPNGKQAAEEGETAALGHEGFGVRHTVSEDGSRIVWSTIGERNHLYLRDTRLGKTIQLDEPEAGAKGGAGDPYFQTANDDDSKIFFTDSARLTTASRTGPDLYMCEVAEAAGQPTCKLKDLSADGNPGEAANVEGLTLGAGEDGRYVYFASNGALTSDATPGNCSPTGTTCNLYVYDTVTGDRRLVAQLSHEDQSDWSTQGGGNVVDTVEVSPNGQYLAFMSQADLTGYDNRDASSGVPDTEVYLYDASSGRLVCASCNPSGARPHGVFDSDEHPPGLLVDRFGASAWGGHWLAGSISGGEDESQDERSTWYQPHYLSDGGRLFFNSADALAPRDTNGLEDVYEYEPEGLGSCAAGSSDCVGLISSGTSGQESALLDASETGEDVFFLTTAKLAATDLDGDYDVYDAHVCTAQSPCSQAASNTPALPCTTEATCKAAPTPQPGIFGTPSSATFNGAGNLSAPPATAKAKPKSLTRAQQLARALGVCRRDRSAKRRLSCEKRARKRYGTKVKSKAKKTTTKSKAKKTTTKSKAKKTNDRGGSR